jgi:peptide/nickel transport system substrate-binding protein
MQRLRRKATAALTVGVSALAIAACGSSGSSSSSSGSSNSSSSSSGGGSSSSVAGPASGPGLNQPTQPSGSKVSGGTVTFSEGASAAPNYIFPMTSAQVCSTANLNQLSYMLYRPLYWYGNNYSPTLDPSYSVGNTPKYTDGDKTVTITLKPWKWSDGETVNSRQVEFWINMYKADPAANYCGYVPGRFPDNVTSVQTPNATTVVLHLDRAYNPEWFTYNELSQIAPVPLAWDRTSLSAPAPKSDNGHLPDATKSGAEAVYKFLDAQSKAVASWSTSPIWKVVDGPFKLQSFTNDGQVTLVPNPDYSGSPKPTIAKFVELPFTSDTAEYNEVRSGGPSAVTIAGLPPQYAPQVSTVTGEGYTDNKAASYSFNYFPLNFHNPQVGPIFSQLYFRQALQHLVDQQGWITAFLNNTANPTYTPIPPAPASPLVDASSLTNPFPFSTSAAASLLKANGWKVVPGGTTTCIKPGSAAGDCGAGIKSGEGISFNIDYQAGVTSIASEMNDLEAQAKKVGISINLTSHPFATVIGAAVACTAKQPTCKWEAENWGAGWIYGPDYLPTGESLYAPGAAANYGSYSDPKATQLINQTVFGPASAEKAALTTYAKYMSQQVPVVFGPTSIGTYQGDAGTLVSSKLGGYTANALGLVNPENWYLTK